MPKYRKMLNDINAPYLQSLMGLIETQSKTTLANWCIDYASAHILPIYENAYPDSMGPKNALAAARDWLVGEVKLPYVKNIILKNSIFLRKHFCVFPSSGDMPDKPPVNLDFLPSFAA